MKNKQYLVSFYYDAYCQGYEEAYEHILVSASSFETACIKIGEKFYRARDFKNLTIE